MLSPSSANWPTRFQYCFSNSPMESCVWFLMERAIARPGCASQPYILSTLLAAITNGVLAFFRTLRDSRVCGLQPSMTSTISIAMSAREPPRERRVENEWWPGVSMNRRPGESNVFPPIRGEHSSLRMSAGTSVAPMCWVMPPASRSMTEARELDPRPLMWSRRDVLPWST